MQKAQPMTSYDQLEMRCPRLGGPVVFSYCRQEGGELPCARVLSCWQPVFSVESYLRENLGEKRWELFCRQAPKDRLTVLISLADAAKKSKR